MIEGVYVHTESNAIGTSRLKRERNERKNGEHDGRHEQIDDVVDRLPSQTYGESQPSVRRIAAVVQRLKFRDCNAWTIL